MNKNTLLCLDSETFKYPFLIGLKDENLSAQSWLHISSDVCDARSFVFDNTELKKVWVVSCDDLDGINLAAALKHDKPELEVSFLSFDMTGSVLSRCHEAGVLPLDKKGFLNSYSVQKTYAENKSIISDSHFSPETLFEVKSESEVDVLEGKTSEGIKNHRMIKESLERISESSLIDDNKELDLDDSLFISQTNLSSKVTEEKDSSVKEVQKRNASLEVRNTQQGNSDDTIPLSLPKTLSVVNQDAKINSIVSRRKENDGYVISVLSGSGGSGKSTISVLLGLALVEMGYKTVVLDADFQFGDISFLLGLTDAITVKTLIEKPEMIADIKRNNSSLPSLVASPSELEYSELAITYLSQVVELLKQNFEVVVINTGSFWNEQHARLLEISNKPLFLMDQRPSSIRSCSHALALCARCGIASQNFSFVLNRCSRQALLTSIDVSCALKGASVYELKEGGKEIGELLSAGLPIELTKEKNALYQSVKALIKEITPLEPKEKTMQQVSTEKKKAFRLLRRKGRAACL